MKQSRYNFFFKLDNGDYLAFNALKNGLAVVGKEVVDNINSQQPGTAVNVDYDILKELKKGGFLIDDDYNEYGVLCIRRHLQQYSNLGLGLTISPSLACNLVCRYCFESTDKSVMDETVMDGLVEYVHNHIKAGIKKLSIGWYGGEPLLGLPVIERLSSEFITLCEKDSVRYSASIITNGTLLDKETAGKLKKLHVLRAQITIDGDKNIHNKMRPFKTGKGSFDAIMENLKEVVGIIPISLRINLDTNNADQALTFIDKLKKEDWFYRGLESSDIHPYYGYIKKYTSTCLCSKDEILKPGDFWAKDLELKKYFYNHLKGFDYYPEVVSGCTATSMSSYVVDAKGNLYKCLNHLGIPEKTVGTIFEPSRLNSLYINYLTESFENDSECMECKYLPICMGGCVDIRVKAKRGEFDAKDCNQWKYYLEEILRYYYLSKIKNRAENSS
jgi:uncharacterized protein